MKPSEVVEILKACEGLSLKSLTIGELKVTFHDLTNLDKSQNNNSTSLVLSQDAPRVITPPIVKESTLENKDEQSELSDFQRDYLMANLMASDPVEYEEMLRKA